jgi:molybdopterin molybdotransferase
MGEFLILRSADEARAILADVAPTDREMVELEAADGRVLAAAITAPEDLPAWPRATMDGYAVRARDTFGASEAVPAFLRVVGTVPMGGTLARAIGAGEAAAIATGGVVPEGADAVVMVEYTQRGTGPDDELEVGKGAAPGDNVVRAGDDLRRSDVVLLAGRRLRPQDVGVVAALGVRRVPVHRRPRVGILSTGNEIVPADRVERPAPGQVRDVNSFSLAAAVRRAGCVAERAGIVRDDADELEGALRELVARCDAVIVSGGSSVGARDLTALVLTRLGAEIRFHGISVRPGKPTILAQAGGKPILGMPGVPVSALVIFDAFVRPLLWRLGGERERDPWPARRRARLSRRVASVAGREDWIRVRLGGPDRDLAEPLLGGSAALTTLLRADGYVVVPAGSEGLAEGEPVEVLLWG